MFDEIWQRLEKKMPVNQILLILLLLVLQKSWDIRLKKGNSNKFNRNHLIQSLMEVGDYDFKEAILRLCEKLDWMIIETDSEVQEILQGAEWKIQNDFCGVAIENLAEETDILFEGIIETAGNAGNYVPTPRSIRKLTEMLFFELEVHTIADICCGLSGYGLHLLKKFKEINQDISYCGIDIDAEFCDISRIRLFWQGIYDIEIKREDILTLKKKPDSKLFDFVLSDIPRGNNKGIPYNSADYRLREFNNKNVYTEWIFIQDILNRLSPQGRAVILVTLGALSRRNEKEFRRQMIQNDWIEAVISLPANLYPNTRVGTEMIILHKNKEKRRKGKVLFIDISKYYFREKRNAYAISEEGLAIAQDAFSNYKEISEISIIEENCKLEKETFSLKPIRYILGQEEFSGQEKIILSEVAELVRGAQIKPDEIKAEDSEACLINVKDIQNGKILFDTAERVDAGWFDRKQKFGVQEDDILIVSKGTAIKMAIAENVPRETYISGNITRIRIVAKKYNPYVLYEYLNSDKGRLALEGIQSGTTIRILNNANLGQLSLPFYPNELMNKVGNELKQKRKEYFAMQENIQESYQKKKKSLLEMLKEE